MSSKTINLDQLRKSLTPEQRCLINKAFDYEEIHKRAIPAVILFDLCGGEQIVSAALASLPARTIWSSPTTGGRRRYSLTFGGYLLSQRGEELQSILARYLDHVRSKMRHNPELDHIEFADLKDDAGFTDDQLEFFQDFIFRTPFHNGGGGNGSGLPPNVDDWYAAPDLYKYVGDYAFRDLKDNVGCQSYLVATSDIQPLFVPNDPAVLPEIKESLALFRRDYPNPATVTFVIMRFGNTPQHQEITQAISDALTPLGITPLRADTKQYHDELFYNILTYLYGCASGVAVFERLEEDAFNPNVAFEVGYMMALKKPVCLLKDRTLKTLHSDLAGKLYRQFDSQHPSATISKELSAWLKDKSFIG